MLATQLLQVPPRSAFKRLMLGTTLWQHAKMSTILKNPKELKDLECERGQQSSRPAILFVPPTDIPEKKESSKILKIKLSNRTVFTMTIFSWGNTKEYLAHIVAVLRLLNQKELNLQCRKLAILLKKQARILSALNKSIGPKSLNFKKSQESWKVEIKPTTEMLEEARKEHNKATTKMYKLQGNLLSSVFQTHWDWICCKMYCCRPSGPKPEI
jgi:hypothetical protein